MRGGGQRSHGTFPKIHPFWFCLPVPKSKLAEMRAKYFIVLSFGGNASGISLHNRRIKRKTYKVEEDAVASEI